MNEITIDVDLLNVFRHDYLKDILGLPDYYGKNRDALYDCLTDFLDKTFIFTNIECANKFSKEVYEVFVRACEENGCTIKKTKGFYIEQQTNTKNKG